MSLSRAAEEEAPERVLPETLPDAPWKKIQQNTFTRWVNQHLACVDLSISDLGTDFSDGLKLIRLVEVLSTRSLGRYNKKVAFRSQKLENCTTALKFLDDEEVKLVNIDSSDIVDHNLKLIMGLIWTLIQHYSISMPVWSDADKVKDNNSKENSPRQRLLAWIKAHVPDDVPVTNFNTDWNDGVALGALVETLCGPLINVDWRNFDPRDADDNTALVMKVAAQKLQVAQLINPEELINPNVDEQSVMTYLSQFPKAYAKYLEHQAEIERKLKEEQEEEQRRREAEEAEYSKRMIEELQAQEEAERLRLAEEEQKRLLEAEQRHLEELERERLLKLAEEEERLRREVEEEERLRQLAEEEEMLRIAEAQEELRRREAEEAERLAREEKLRQIEEDLERERLRIEKEEAAKKQSILEKETELGFEELKDTTTPQTRDLRCSSHSSCSTDSTCSSSSTSSCSECDDNSKGDMPTEQTNDVVHQRTPNHLRCFAKGPGLTEATVNVPTWFEVNTQDSDRPGHLQFLLKGPSESQTSVKDHSDGSCTFEYTALTPGRYIIDVLYADVDDNNQEMAPEHIPGSPFHVTVVGGPESQDLAVVKDKSGVQFANSNGNGSAPDDRTLKAVSSDLESYSFIDNYHIGSREHANEYSLAIQVRVDDLCVQDLTPVITMPSGAQTQNAEIVDNHDGTILVKYQPKTQGKHELSIQHNGHNLKGGPIVFYVDDVKNGFVTVYGPGLRYAVVGEPAAFTVCAAGGIKTDLVVSIEGNGKANVQSHDNKDGTCSVTWVPPVPGEYQINVKIAGKLVKGGPFKVLVAGEGHKRAHLSVGSTSEVSLNIIEASLKGISASIKSPHGIEEPCFIRHIDATHIGVSFTPREVGEHLINVKKEGHLLPKCPFRIKVDKSQVGDSSKVICTGSGISTATSQEFNEFTVDTTKAGYGGLSVSVEGPSKAEIICKEAKNGVVKIAYKPTEPGVYALAVKFADNHIKDSPFNVNCTGKGAGSVSDSASRPCVQAPIVLPEQEAVLFAKLPNTNPMDMTAKVMCPNGRSEDIEMRDLGDCFYQLKFVPKVEGLHVVSVLHKEQHVNGSPYQYSVGPFTEGGAHKVRAGGPGLVRGETVHLNSFNIFTREAGAGKLAVTIEGPSKAAMEFKDHKNGNCHLQYKVQQPGEYIVAVKFNDTHIPDSPFKVFIAPSTGEARKLELASFPDMGLPVGKACTFTVLTHRARGHLEAKVVTPSNSVETIDIVPIDEGESYAMRFIPREPGNHYVHVTLDGAPMRDSPFRIRVGGKDSSDPTAVHASGDGLRNGQTGQKCEFIINTCNAGAGLLQVQIDGPSKVTLDAYELDTGYKARYTPLSPGDYFAAIKYAGIHIPGSPFKIKVDGAAIGGGSGFNESSLVKIDAVAKTSKGTVAQAPTYKGDASKVTAKGAGLKKFFPGRPAMFTIDTAMAGPNLLFIGVVTNKGPCEEVLVKHHGQGNYIVNYKIHERTKGFIFVKYGDDQIPGSPFAVEP